MHRFFENTIIKLVGVTADVTGAMKVVQATAAAGTGSKDVTGAALTTAALTGKWAAINVESRKLDLTGDFIYVAVDIAGTASPATYINISEYDRFSFLRTVTEIFFIGTPRIRPVTQGADCNQVVHVDG